MHKNATKCNKTQSKWCINKHGASKIIDTFETYQRGGRDSMCLLYSWCALPNPSEFRLRLLFLVQVWLVHNPRSAQGHFCYFFWFTCFLVWLVHAWSTIWCWYSQISIWMLVWTNKHRMLASHILYFLSFQANTLKYYTGIFFYTHANFTECVCNFFRLMLTRTSAWRSFLEEEEKVE
jgi:hypothetical protein